MNIIAEIGNAHNGDVREAIAYIRACAAAGVWGVKFQLHHPSEPDRGWKRLGRPIYHPQDKTRADYWKRIAFTLDQWTLLAEEAAKCCVNFGVSIFQPDIWGHIDITHLLDFIKTPCDRHDELCVAIPCDIDWIWSQTGIHRRKLVTPKHTQLAGLFCSFGYPSEQFPCSQDLQASEWDGISSHHGSVQILDIALEAQMLFAEIHVTWSRQQLHPDACCSLTVEELTKWIQSQ